MDIPKLYYVKYKKVTLFANIEKYQNIKLKIFILFDN